MSPPPIKQSHCARRSSSWSLSGAVSDFVLCQNRKYLQLVLKCVSLHQTSPLSSFAVYICHHDHHQERSLTLYEGPLDYLHLVWKYLTLSQTSPLWARSLLSHNRHHDHHQERSLTLYEGPMSSSGGSPAANICFNSTSDVHYQVRLCWGW